MNPIERFLAVCRGEQPDCVPIFGMPGAPGMARGAQRRESWEFRRERMTPGAAWSADRIESVQVCDVVR